MTEQSKAPDGYLQQYDGFEKDWLSTSALACFQQCPQKFEYRYIKRLPATVNVRMAAGIGAHKGRETNLSQKVQSEDNIALAEVCDVTRDAVHQKFAGAEYRSGKEFEGISERDARGIAIDKAVDMVTVDYEDFQIELLPAHVELPIVVDYKSMSRLICGKLDVLDRADVIIDLKTGKRAKGQSWCDTAQGLTTYGMLFLCQFGRVPGGYQVQNVVDKKAGPESITYETDRTKEELKQQLGRFARVERAIQTGVFPPCNPEDWGCSKAWCPYWEHCEFFSGKE